MEGLQNVHSKFNAEFIRTLILIDKFEEAFAFSKSVWNDNEFIFEADLLLGLDYFINKDYTNAEKHFKRLNQVSRYNPFFRDFIGNILIAWTKASENNKEESFNFFDKIPERYHKLKKVQNSFLQCYFDTSRTQATFEQLINSPDASFSRYNFFFSKLFTIQK